MPSLPNSLSLTNIADGSLAVASDERNNFSAIQSAVNALIAALSGGASGAVLQAQGGTNVGYAAVAAAVTNANIGVANTDLAYPGGIAQNYVVATTAGGTLRSIGAAPIAGVKLTLKNGTTSFIRLLHATAGGGAQLSIIGAGHKFLAPGQSIELVYDGANWQEINRPAKELIADVTLSGAQATFDTDTILGVAASIPQVYNHLEVVVNAHSDAAANSVSVAMRFNGDSAGNYWQGYLTQLSNVASGTAASAQSSAYIGTITADSQAANLSGHSVVEIPNYTSATYQRQATWRNTERSQSRQDYGGSGWFNASALTRITLILSAGNFKVGSRFSLYGIT